MFLGKIAAGCAVGCAAYVIAAQFWEIARLQAQTDALRRDLILFNETFGKVSGHLATLNEELRSFDKSSANQVQAIAKAAKLMAYLDGRTLGPAIAGNSPWRAADVCVGSLDSTGCGEISMLSSLDNLLAGSASLLEDTRSVLQISEQRQVLVDGIPTLLPAQGWLSSTFGMRVSPITGKRAMHRGVDIAGMVGSDIVSAGSGVVRRTGKRERLGNFVEIEHSHGIVTRYGHNSKVLVREGETVKRGQVIATMGRSGKVTGPHLHFEVRVGDMALNPEIFLVDDMERRIEEPNEALSMKSNAGDMHLLTAYDFDE